MASRIEGDFTFVGNVVFAGGMAFPTATIDNAAVKTDAKIAYSKLQHEHRARVSQVGTAATATQAVHRARNAGRLIDVQASVITAAIGDSTVTVDVKKNGTTLLTGVITINNGIAAYGSAAGTPVGSPTIAAGDILTVVITATIGTGTLPTGLLVTVALYEEGT